MTKVAIIVPNTGMVHHNTVVSLTGMVYDSSHLQLIYHSPSMAGVSKVRNYGVALALADKEVTHTLWVDSDMTFPSDALERLLSHDLPIVGCAYSKRDGKGVVASSADGKQLTTIPKDGVHKAKVLGFGLILIQRSVYEAMEMPYFYEPWVEGHGPVGEDAYFLLQASDKGVDTYYDAELSNQVGHLGVTEFML